MTHFNANTLNRLGPLRTNTELLKTMFSSELSQTLFFKGKMALFDKNGSLAWIKPKKLSFLDTTKLFNPKDIVSDNSLVVLLGCKGLESHYQQPEKNNSFWAIEASNFNQEGKEFVKRLEDDGFQFSKLGLSGFSLNPEDASVLGQASALVVWNLSHQFCSGCGNPTVSEEVGYKRKCIGSSGCLTNKNTSGISYPRTDACVIVCISSEDGERILLGRKESWPKNRYSCLSGFVEPAESIESAARREVLEESGVVLENIKYFGSQAWPFPSNLMLGFSATTSTTEIVKTDKEMEDIKWFKKDQVCDAIKNARYSSTHDSISDTKNIDDDELVLPPPVSISHELIRSWAML